MGNILAGMWAGVKTIFGAGGNGANNVMAVANGIGNFIDEQEFTEEEKARFNAELITQYGTFMESTVNENTERSRTRRDLSLWIIRTEIAFLTLSIIAYKIDSGLSAFIYSVATNAPMSYLTMGVGAFFFGAHIIRTTRGE